jgi:hypothetical protein
MVNGQSFSGTSFQLDGTDNRDPILGIIVINPILDAVTEAKVTTGNYDAEFGQALAGVVTAQTKSGTNDLHGSAYLYRRNDVTSARDPFSQPAATGIPPTLWDQFGGSLGGPIKKDKTFIFGAYQGDRRKAGGSLLTRVPTTAERAGDLSDLGVNIYDPYDVSGNPVAPAARTQFDGSVIPASRLSPQALAILKLIPLANLSGATGTAPNYTGNVTQIFNDDQFSIHKDQSLSDEQTSSFRTLQFRAPDQIRSRILTVPKLNAWARLGGLFCPTALRPLCWPRKSACSLWTRGTLQSSTS